MRLRHGFIGKMSGRSRPDHSSDDAMDALVEHLQLLFNTRKGSVGHLPDYGLPDISEVFQSFPDSMDMLRRAIQQTIEKYEPRVKNPRVRLLDTTSENRRLFRATFQISGVLQHEEGQSKIQLSTIVSERGHAVVG